MAKHPPRMNGSGSIRHENQRATAKITTIAEPTIAKKYTRHTQARQEADPARHKHTYDKFSLSIKLTIELNVINDRYLKS